MSKENKRVYFLTVVFLILAACASSPKEMRETGPLYQVSLSRPLNYSVNCVSRKIDEMPVGILEDPLTQSVKMIPGQNEATIYLSGSKAANILMIDFTGSKPTKIKVYANSNTLHGMNSLRDQVESCK